MEILLDYAVFLAKTVTLFLAALFLIGGIASIATRHRQAKPQGYIEVQKLNSVFKNYEMVMHEAMLPPADFKQYLKQQDNVDKEADKKAAAEKKSFSKDQDAKPHPSRKRLFYLEFKGDIQASSVAGLCQEVSAVLVSANQQDEILMSIESGGGTVSGYGFGASQLQRIRDKGLHLTVAVDKVAASGGYLMACIANKIIASPFALVGSIGVMAQIPNFHRLLKKHDVDMDVFTAGEFKRTVTLFGENTDVAKAKFQQELESVHDQFKAAVLQYRPDLDIARASTGETWLAEEAKGIGLVDELSTSDAYLMDACKSADVFKVKWVSKRTPLEKIMNRAEAHLTRWVSAVRAPYN